MTNPVSRFMTNEERLEHESITLQMHAEAKTIFAERDAANALLAESNLFPGIRDKFSTWDSRLREDAIKLLQAIQAAKEKNITRTEVRINAFKGDINSVLGYKEFFHAITSILGAHLTIKNGMADGHEYSPGWATTTVEIDLDPPPLPTLIQHTIEDIVQMVADV